MKLPNAAHESRPWRIREIVADFRLEDVWALPIEGGADDFPEALRVATSFSPADSDSVPARLLWDLRDRLGRLFDLGRVSEPVDGGLPVEEKLPIPGTSETSLLGRLPEDLRGTADGVKFGSLPFEPLYRTDDEFAAEISNKTVHGVMHMAWADMGGGRYQGQMAVYVKPRGRFGGAYMNLIKPFRLLIVYPALMRQIERAWSDRSPATPAAAA
ncbi:hypothetical protein BH10ACT11_BH10ACT11_20530 [soil metagenome]